MDHLQALLDLSITLSSPPPASLPEVIASIEVRCERLNLGYTGSLLTDPLTQQERDELRWYLEEYWKWPYLEFAEHGKQVEALLIDIGKRLYDAVFGNAEAQGLFREWQKRPDGFHQISIVSGIASALSLPWELLHDTHGFLTLRPGRPIPIVRRLPLFKQPDASVSYKPPLRVLLITARPEGAGFIDPRSIARELMDEIQAQVEAGTIEIEFLRPPTLSTLRARLENIERPIHVLHFDGHGIFDAETSKQGMLAFETESGKLNLVKATDLAKVLQDSWIRLVVLNACQSAMSTTDDVFSSVATQLISSGIDAVIAMSASFLVASAVRYVEALYRELAAGTTIPIAQERARRVLHDDLHRHPHRRHWDEEGVPVELQDWWVPHFYQQQPLILQPESEDTIRQQQRDGASISRLSEFAPSEPHYGFSGRARELLQIERWLIRKKPVVIHGFGGIGKTALVREAAEWLTRTGLYSGACFVSFEYGGDAAWVLSALGSYLGMYDANYNPNEQTSALIHLEPILKERHILVIADNLETILPHGEASLTTEARSQLWDLLFELARMDVGILLTTRDTGFRDERLAMGGKVAYLELKGLHPEDAYALSIRLLDKLGIDRSRASYSQLRDLLAQLDHHPLAIQLVLPALLDLSLSKIKGDFVELLPRFVDDVETGHNRSLLASLDYSLRRITEEQRALLFHLAVFEGGAWEYPLLQITQIPEEEWIMLRSVLEMAALLSVEHIENTPVPFLHFHPVLVPFLRSQTNVDDALRQRYVQGYDDLASFLYKAYGSRPLSTRAIAWRELPNLRRALEMLIERHDLSDAVSMTEHIARFLTLFGMERERDKLRRHVEGLIDNSGTDKSETMTWEEWFRECVLYDDEYLKGNLHEAAAGYKNLLARIEALPEGTPLGRGSYQHCETLAKLARCLRDDGKSKAAEGLLREALTIIDGLLSQRPDEQDFINQRGRLFALLGEVYFYQGQYQQAQEAYEEGLKIFQQTGDTRSQAALLGNLGTFAMFQEDYAQAHLRYTQALQLYRLIKDPDLEARIWHQLGMLMQDQKNWTEAERCFRESLEIKERLGDVASAASTYGLLARNAERAGRPNEAEGWFRRALAVNEQVPLGGLLHSALLSDLADFLAKEVRANRAPKTRLAEAREYAMQALEIKEKLDASTEIWMPLSILATIADLEGEPEKAADYRDRERETYAAFVGNRSHVDKRWGTLIADVVAAANGDIQVRKKVEAALPGFEARGWRFSDAIMRIWAGERDRRVLVEDLGGEEALLIQRILESLAHTTNTLLDALPPALLEVLKRGDENDFERVWSSLTLEEQQAVAQVLKSLPEQEDETKNESDTIDMAAVIRQLEPLLQTIAEVAMGNTELKDLVEAALADLEKRDWHLSEVVERIWAGERDPKILTERLDEQETILIQHVLNIIAST